MGSYPGTGLSLWNSHALPMPAWLLSRFSGSLPQSKNMHGIFTELYKLAIGVTVGVCLDCTPPLAQSQLG